MIRDTTNAKKNSMTKYKMLMKTAIKLATREDFKKDITIVKKNSMAQLFMFYKNTVQVSRADASTETTEPTIFKTMTANAPSMRRLS
jgi:hypothetical protein